MAACCAHMAYWESEIPKRSFGDYINVNRVNYAHHPFLNSKLLNIHVFLNGARFQLLSLFAFCWNKIMINAKSSVQTRSPNTQQTNAAQTFKTNKDLKMSRLGKHWRISRDLFLATTHGVVLT